ncbi:hypothetical protein AAMO2058_000173400 [Amorphochlora amoebiformis]
MIKLKGSIELQVVCFLAFSGSCFGAGGTSVKSLEASVAEDSSQEKDRAHDNATARMVHNDSCIDCVFSLGVETGSVKKYPGRHFFERFYDSDDMTKPRKKDFAEIIPGFRNGLHTLSEVQRSYLKKITLLPPNRRLILLTTSRSGSTWLTQLMSVLPDILFHSRQCLSSTADLRICDAEWGLPPRFPSFVSMEHTPPEFLLPSLFRQPNTLPNGPKTYIGFRWMAHQGGLWQNPQGVRSLVDFIRDHNIKLIVLNRENDVHKCVDLFDLKIRKSKRSSKLWGSQIQNNTVPISFMEQCLRWYRDVKKIVGHVKSQVHHLEVFYEDLCDNPRGQLANIAAYLQLNSPSNVQLDNLLINLRPRQQLKASNLILNWEKLKAELYHHGHDRAVVLAETPVCESGEFRSAGALDAAIADSNTTFGAGSLLG